MHVGLAEYGTSYKHIHYHVRLDTRTSAAKYKYYKAVDSSVLGSLSTAVARYAHYDNNPSFSDFAKFGGWDRPSLKQYDGNKYLCSK